MLWALRWQGFSRPVRVTCVYIVSGLQVWETVKFSTYLDEEIQKTRTNYTQKSAGIGCGVEATKYRFLSRHNRRYFTKQNARQMETILTRLSTSVAAEIGLSGQPANQLAPDQPTSLRSPKRRQEGATIGPQKRNLTDKTQVAAIKTSQKAPIMKSDGERATAHANARETKARNSGNLQSGAILKRKTSPRSRMRKSKAQIPKSGSVTTKKKAIKSNFWRCEAIRRL